MNILILLVMSYFVLYLSIAIHEAGHFFFCYLFKVPIHRVIIGGGPKLFKIKKFEFYMLPLGGGNIPYSYDLNLSKGKAVLVFLGGILANFISIFIFFYFPLWIFWNVIMVIANLIPIRNKKTISDGLFVISILYDMDFVSTPNMRSIKDSDIEEYEKKLPPW